jgi:hypothetical protein
MVFLSSMLANKNLCFTFLHRLLIEPVHVSLVDVEKLTTTSRRLPHNKSRQETQSTAAFVKPSTALSGATAVSGETAGGLEVETPTCLQDNS